MKTLELTIADRVTLLSVLNQQQGMAVEMFKVYKLIEKFELSDDELKSKENTSVQVELTDSEFTKVGEYIKKFPHFRPVKEVFELFDKFGIEVT
jgi:hypothetical protein